MGNDGKILVYGVAAVGFGVYLFYRGFRELRLRRLIEEIGTSKIRSLAMGLVELAGRAAPTIPLNDPVYEKPCVYFHVVVKEKRGSGKHTRWVTVYANNTDHIPFYLNDDTGRVLVSPSGAETFFENDIDLTISPSLFSTGSDDAITRFVARLPGGGAATVSIKARVIREHETAYVLGYAVPGGNPFTLREKIMRPMPEKVRLSLNEVARQLKADPGRMRTLDKNGDNQIDSREWDEGLRAFQQELETAQAKAAAAAPTPVPESSGIPAVLVRKTPDGLLVISDKEEQALLTHLGRWSLLKIIGGPVLTLIGTGILIQRFG